MKTKIVAVLLILGVLAGCDQKNTDPRKGEVDLGSYNFKVCAGPDLLYHIETGRRGIDRWIRNSPECKP